MVKVKYKNKFDEKWKLIRGQSTEWWSLMAETDLKKVDKAEDKLDKFVTILQVKYGFTRQQAIDRKSTRLNSSHIQKSRMPSSA